MPLIHGRWHDGKMAEDHYEYDALDALCLAGLWLGGWLCAMWAWVRRR